MVNPKYSETYLSHVPLCPSQIAHGLPLHSKRGFVYSVKTAAKFTFGISVPKAALSRAIPNIFSGRAKSKFVALLPGQQNPHLSFGVALSLTSDPGLCD